MLFVYNPNAGKGLLKPKLSYADTVSPALSLRNGESSSPLTEFCEGGPSRLATVTRLSAGTI